MPLTRTWPRDIDGLNRQLTVQYENITTDRELRDFCDVISSAAIVAFDTEFVSEDTYTPELCLIQVAAGGHLAIIDPLEVHDLLPFWQLLVAPGRETLVHAGREEFRFCLRATGKRPYQWFDVQLAAGLIGLEYPASYGTLTQRLLGKSLSKDETRTDWRRRPLSTKQLEYALKDVADLEAMRNILHERLTKLGRLSWIETELSDWQLHIEQYEASERWQRMGGISGMSPRSLAVVREIWNWRDSEAQRRNIPPRRILRDDLIVELAKRKSADVRSIRALRGLERGDIQKHIPKISQSVERALDLAEADLPRQERHPSRPQLNLLGQFLSTALGSICRRASVAASMVGTAQDVRDLIAYRLGLGGFAEGEIPVLAQGWRAEVVGQVIDHLLAGDLSIRIADPLSDEPLAFEPRSTQV
jgi:ribonuclease D